MGMFSGQKRGPAGSTDGIADKTVDKFYAVIRDAIYIRGLDKTIIISAQGLVGMIVGHDKYDIGTLCVLIFLLLPRTIACPRKYQEEKQYHYRGGRGVHL